LPEYLAGASFLDAERGFLLCGDQPATIQQFRRLYETVDGGLTWRRRPLELPMTGHAAGIEFRSPRQALMLANRLGLYVTRDGGRWETSLFTDDRPFVSRVSWPTATRAYALLSSGQLLRFGGAFLDERHWWLIGVRCPPGKAGERLLRRQPNCPGGILRTRDGGRQWELVRLRMIPGSVVFDFVSPAVGFAKDPWAGPYRTSDGGRTWRYVYPRS
jgi:hypothetical protein